MMPNPTPTIRDVRGAAAGDVDLLAGLVTRAFHHLSVSAWLVPDPEQRRRVLSADFAILIAHALDVGYVHTTAAMSGVAVWLPADPALDIPGCRERLAAIAGDHLPRFTQFDAMLQATHPATTAHVYLQLLAVEPDHQGRGLGSALLAYAHRRFDDAQLPTYLEASSPDSARLYARHGYQPYGSPIALGAGVAEMRPMWREPRPAGAP